MSPKMDVAFGPDNPLQHDIAAPSETNWGHIVGTYDKDAGTNIQRPYLNGVRVAEMSDTLPIDLNSAALGVGRPVSGIADPFNGHIDAFRISHVQRSDGCQGTSADRCPVYPRIHSAIDLTTAYELLGAD